MLSLTFELTKYLFTFVSDLVKRFPMTVRTYAAQWIWTSSRECLPFSFKMNGFGDSSTNLPSVSMKATGHMIFLSGLLTSDRDISDPESLIGVDIRITRKTV